ncbi:hypothetical protein IWX90DRAFT_242754 [Phyllosticta citrichinensis]|uniref:Multiple RNA-binding domain-containing protein 1 n=1 Tax=Phyllosticta citrichinensis TaxID=1130410 RepID=A0ABR1XQA8_9PEZI
MASSRIYISSLPPTLSDAEFKKHFAQQDAITDAKLLAHRRIGFVGYKTPEAAAKAVKYFNKTFIRMSRIGVTLADPVGQAPEPRKRKRTPTAQVSDEKEHKSPASPENALKRKRGVDQEVASDPKLKEFMEVMKAPSKVKAWQNDDIQVDQTVVESDTNVETVQVEEAESDEEYQTVEKKPKRVSPPPPAEPIPAPKDTKETEPEASQPALEDAEDAQAPAGPVTDEDWLRSKTSRLLGLVDDNEEEATLRPKPSDVDKSADVSGNSHARDVVQDLARDVAQDQEDQSPDSKSSEQVETEIDKIHQTGRLFLRNLPYDVSEDEIRKAFRTHGDLEEVHVPLDPKTSSGKGFAYVLFQEPDHAVQAYEEMDGRIFQGRLLHILPAAAKRENKLDEFAISKLPLKKQKQIMRKAESSKTTFNWNSLYMKADSVMSSVADRLGVSKSELLDPTSADAAVKQAHAETHVIQETKAYFTHNGVDLDAFKHKARGDTAILVKNFPYGTKPDELKKMFEDHGKVTRFLMPPSGTIAIVEFASPPQARSAFASLAYRKIKDSILFLEKAPKDLFKEGIQPITAPGASLPSTEEGKVKMAASDLLAAPAAPEQIETSTLYVRNLNFATTSQRLTEVLKPLDGFVSATVRTKTDPKKPGQTLSMGFGFLEFRTKQQAQAALAAMDGYNLDGHQLSIKASHKGLDAAEERRREDKVKKAATTKIIIKNLPFQATKKDVRALFGAYGQLRSVRVPKKFDASARGFAFADFTTPREAENAMDALRSTHLLGRKLVLDFASEDPEDAEEEIAKMQKKVGTQVNKVALQNLTGAGRRKFNVAGNDDLGEA